LVEPGEKQGKSRFAREALKIAAVLFALVGLMLWLSGGFIGKVKTEKPEISISPQEKPRSIKTERRTFPLLVEQVGTVRALNEAQVASRIMAQVEEILAREGDLVSGGQGKEKQATVLAVLDDREIQARVAQAQSQLAAVQRGVEIARARLVATRAQVESARANREKVVSDYRRYEDLYRSKAATGQQLEHAKAQKDMIEAQLQALIKDVQAAESEIGRSLAQQQQTEAVVREARAMLDHTVIRAPFSGRILRKMVDVGDMAIPGSALFLMDSPSNPELHIHLSESVLSRLLVGQELEVRIDALGRTLTGRLREIPPKADPRTRTVLAKVSLPADPELVNGMYGKVQIPQGEYQGIVIPRGAVQEVGQLPLVVVVDPERGSERRFVTLGTVHGNMVEVLSGLEENEEVVIP
jgi:multidrug efflux pump subunit AcrA (membrane-fusion protein)